MTPSLSALIDNSKLERLIAEIEVAQNQTQPVAATEKLHAVMFEIGRAVALDPGHGPKTAANEGTFQKLFGPLELDSRLLRITAAVEGFRAGVNAVEIL
jgi:hypothetical protein